MALVTKKKGAKKSVALPQLGSFNFDRYRIQVGEDPKSRAKRYISPLDLAREAEELHRSQAKADQRLNDFAGHMIALAATCANPDEYRDVCTQIRDEYGWGRSRPAPRIWIVYQSAIFQFWKKYKIRPLAEVSAPVVENGRLLIDSRTGDVKKEKVKISSVHYLKQAERGFQLMSRAKARAPENAGNQVAELVDKTQTSASDPYLVESMKRLVWAYTHLDRDSQKALLSGFGRLLKEFPVGEPFPG